MSWILRTKDAEQLTHVTSRKDRNANSFRRIPYAPFCWPAQAARGHRICDLLKSRIFGNFDVPSHWIGQVSHNTAGLYGRYSCNVWTPAAVSVKVTSTSVRRGVRGALNNHCGYQRLLRSEFKAKLLAHRRVDVFYVLGIMREK